MNKLYIVIPLSIISLIIHAQPQKLRHAAFADVRFSPLSGTVNVIANNAGDGVLITNNSDNNTVQNNAIGTDLSGQRNMGNGGAGVHINITSSNNLIGSTTPALGNLIAFNTKGVIVGDSATDLSVGDAIINNSIYSNTLIGIDLANNGPTPNHATSPSVGPNDFQNFPIITSLALSGSGLVISWTLNSVPSSSFLLQFFSNNPGDPEGRRVIGNATATTDAGGNASGTITVGTVALNTPITATATLEVGGIPNDTSEFSTPAVYGVTNPCPVTCNK